VTQAYARGEATLADWQALSRNERTALFAFFTAGNRSKQLHFYNIQVDSLVPYAQHEVHGLLGQRAISPAPMKQPPIEKLGGGAKEQSEFASQATTTIAAALGLGGGGVGTSTTIRATVQADGPLQGEGAIEGTYRDYQVIGSPHMGPALLRSRASPSAWTTGAIEEPRVPN